MEFRLQCVCGRVIPVPESAAGTTVPCECGRGVKVPSRPSAPEERDSEVVGVERPSSLWMLVGLAFLAYLACHSYILIEHFALQNRLSSQGRSATAKVIGRERKVTVITGQNSLEDAEYAWYSYDLEYDGYHGIWRDDRLRIFFEAHREFRTGDEIPVLYLESDPAKPTMGRLGDSTLNLVILNYGWWTFLGGSCSGIIVLAFAVFALHFIFRLLASPRGAGTYILGNRMAESFEADPKIAEIAAAYSLKAVDLAAINFGVKLDWSDSSVQKVEQILVRLHDDMAQSNPPEEAVWTFAKAFGSYVGEVLRKHHGGEWGMVNLNGQSFPGIQQDGERLCWPWGRAHKRIVNGPEDNIWHYYQLLLTQNGGASETGDDKRPTKPWWRFW